MSTEHEGCLLCMATDIQRHMWVNSGEPVRERSWTPGSSGLFRSQNTLDGNPSGLEAFRKPLPRFNYSFHASFARTLAGWNANSWPFFFFFAVMLLSWRISEIPETQPPDTGGWRWRQSRKRETDSSSRLAHNPPSPQGFPSVSHRGEWETGTTRESTEKPWPHVNDCLSRVSVTLWMSNAVSTIRLLVLMIRIKNNKNGNDIQ